MTSIHLQGIGRVRAKKARDIKIGTDFFVWNYGSTSKPLRRLKETKTQIVFRTKTRDGRLWERRLKKDRLVGVTSKGGF